MATKIPYIGSKISLISKAQIRYEGTLYTINPYEATVALSNVRSFGTENREANLVVPPKEEVYEYIIFRGSDIKDIHVCERPPLPQDPAIVESSQPKPAPIGSQDGPHGPHSQFGATTSFSQFSQGRGAIPQPGISAAPGSGLPPSAPPHHSAFLTQNTSSQSSTPGTAATTSVARSDGAGRQTPTQDQSTQVTASALMPKKVTMSSNNVIKSKTGSRGSTPDPGHAQSNEQGGAHHQHSQRGGGRQGQQRRQGAHHIDDDGNQQPRAPRRYNEHGRDHRGAESSRGGRDGGEYRERNDSRGRPFKPRGGGGRGGREYVARGPEHGGGERGGFRPRGVSSGGGGGGGGGGGMARGRRGMPNSARPRERLRFDEDFDFETANAQFNKDDLEKELREKLSLEDKVLNGDEGSNAGSDDECTNFYDKENFFDNISCEARDREEGKRSRPNWKEERKTNTETFGMSSTRDLRYYGRGGYRGRGGGGGGGYMNYRGGPRGGSRGGGGGSGQRGGGGGGRGGNWRGRNNTKNLDGERSLRPSDDYNRQSTTTSNEPTPAEINLGKD